MRKSVDTVNQSSVPADEDVFELMHAVMHQARSRPHRGVEDGREGLGPMEGKVLAFFTRQPGATQSDLVAHSGRDKGQLARLIAGLKERGLLDAKPDEQDRRVTRLYPTAQARAVHAEVQRQRRQISAKAVAGLSVDQKRQLLDLLRLIQHNLQATEDEAGERRK